MLNSRRDFFKMSALGAAAMVLGKSAVFPVKAAPAKEEKLKLGVASYSLRAFKRPEAIQMINDIGAKYVSIKSFHLDYNLNPQEIAAAAAEFENAGLTIVGGGVITLDKDDDEDIKKYFEYAKKAKMPLMTIAPTRETLPRIEKFVKQYDIKVAVHNHGPEDKNFPAPSDAIKVIKNMDPRVGVCIDVGHTTRTGNDIIKEIADAGKRVLDFHIKDLKDLMDKDSQCNVGEGAMPVAEIFKQLIKMNYQGYVNLEYEINVENPLEGMKLSFAYMHGVLAGIG
jgi:sugar phosphate isomerase/epimerase